MDKVVLFFFVCLFLFVIHSSVSEERKMQNEKKTHNNDTKKHEANPQVRRCTKTDFPKSNLLFFLAYFVLVHKTKRDTDFSCVAKLRQKYKKKT